MPWPFSNETYTPLTRRSRNSEPLTPEEAKYVLKNPFNTGYTYAKSSSYSTKNPEVYIHPMLGRQPNLSSSFTDGSFSSDYHEQNLEEKSFFKRILDTVRYHGTPTEHGQEKKDIIISILVVLGGLLLLLSLLFLAPRNVDESSRAYDIVSYPFGYGWNATKNFLFRTPSTIEDDPPSINEDHYASKVSQWETELDEIRKEVRSIGAVSQETSDAKIPDLIDAQMRRVEEFINSSFEKEHEMLRMEKEQLKKAADRAPTHVHHHHHTNVHVSEEEVAELVQRSLKNVNLTSMVEEAVRYHISESESQLTVNINELVEKKIIAIHETLRRFSYDKTGEADFALESAGGSVISTRHTEDWIHHSRRDEIWGIPLWYKTYSPRSVIQRQSQNVNAGECWAVKGAEAYLVIKLAQNIDVTAVSYEHIPRELAITGNINSAPKKFKIYSLQEENDPNKFLIGEYVYDDNGEPLQRFAAQHHDPRGTPFIEFELHSNYGAAFTCLYRFRVHGNPQGIIKSKM